MADHQVGEDSDGVWMCGPECLFTDMHECPKWEACHKYFVSSDPPAPPADLTRALARLFQKTLGYVDGDYAYLTYQTFEKLGLMKVGHGKFELTDLGKQALALTDPARPRGDKAR